MSEEDALLATLADSPADDTVRLVYADWLDERNRPNEAAYLRAVVACAAAGGAVPDALIDLAEPLPREWRMATAARFALAMEWRASGRKLHAIKLVRELTGLGLAEAKAFVEAEPDGSLFLMTAEDADGIARHHHAEKFTVRAEVESLLGRRTPASGTFAIGAGLWLLDQSRDGAESGSDARLAFRDFVSAALRIPHARADEKVAETPYYSLELSHGHSLRQAHTEMSRLLSLLPPDDPNRGWKITLGLHPRVT